MMIKLTIDEVNILNASINKGFELYIYTLGKISQKYNSTKKTIQTLYSEVLRRKNIVLVTCDGAVPYFVDLNGNFIAKIQ
jgi:hypothetical protein